MWAQAPSRGFLGGWSRADTLKPGTVIDRYGGETGRFFSPQGTPLDARALPTGSGPLNTYEVLKPLR
ncbi:MAG: TNT domain-containing protein [bacterium]|nr:TNT domain-containing protein [bacterium]